MIITNGKIITWGEPNQILENQALLIQAGEIQTIAPFQSLAAAHPEEEVLDAHGQYIMPGNICAHTHFYGAFARGMAIVGDPPADFPAVLRQLWWRLDKQLDAEGIKYSALVCLLDAIRHGTTTLIDHHASPNAIDGSLDIIADAVNMTGMRASLCYEVTDRDGAVRSQAGVRENVRFCRRVQQQSHDMANIRAHFGLHASLTLSAETLDACRQACPDGIGFHIHAAEALADEQDSLQKSGKRVIQRLAEHGILNPATIVAHGVHCDADEIALLASNQVWLSHQPRSNMNNGVGVAAVEKMMQAGVNVCMGNDGFSNTMWQEWKAAYLVHKLDQRDPRAMNGYDVIKMAVHNNARLVSNLFGKPVGEIKAGAAADIIFVDYHPYTPLHSGNLPWHILFGFQECMVTMTMTAGKILMKDGQFTTVDAEDIYEKAMQASVQTWQRYAK